MRSVGREWLSTYFDKQFADNSPKTHQRFFENFQISEVMFLFDFHKNWASSDISSAFRKFSGNFTVAIQLFIPYGRCSELSSFNCKYFAVWTSQLVS